MMKNLLTLFMVGALIASGSFNAFAAPTASQPTDEMKASSTSPSDVLLKSEKLIDILVPELKGNESAAITIFAALQTTSGTKTDRCKAVSHNLIYQSLTGLDEETLYSACSKIYDIQYNLLPVYQHRMQNRGIPEDLAEGAVSFEEVARAPADGVYYGAADERNTYSPYGLSDEEIAEAKANGGRIQHTGSYTWGMTTCNGKLYFGTVHSYLCTPNIAKYMAAFSGVSYLDNDLVNDCMVCQYKNSHRFNEIVPTQDGGTTQVGYYGGIDVPRVYCYDPATGLTEDISPAEDSEEHYQLTNCQGLRSAYTFDDIVFLGGPGLVGGTLRGSSSVFIAYDTRTGKYIGASSMNDIDGAKVTNVRRWYADHNHLYVTVSITDAEGVEKGAILRWYGDRSNPFLFHIVGYIDQIGAEITVHNGHFYVGGWPYSNTASEAKAAVYRGPEATEEGLTPENAYEWPAVWCYNDYDKYNVGTIGAFVSFDGKLYWGTLCTSYLSLINTMQRYKGKLATPNGLADAIANLATATFWRLDDSECTGDTSDDLAKIKIDLLYGDDSFMINKGGTGMNGDTDPEWVEEPNPAGYSAKYGKSGFGDMWNNYIWTSCVYKDHLYIGTMKCASLFDALGQTLNANLGASMKTFHEALGVTDENLGHLCVRFDDSNSPAQIVSDNGMGNDHAYGIRNMSIIGDDLYVGTANPYNTNDQGGWQVYRLRDNKATGINTVKADKVANIVMKRQNGYVMFYTMNGEAIKTVKMYDTAGRLIKEDAPANHIGYIFTSGVNHGSYVITVETASGTTTAKVLM